MYRRSPVSVKEMIKGVKEEHHSESLAKSLTSVVLWFLCKDCRRVGEFPLSVDDPDDQLICIHTTLLTVSNQLNLPLMHLLAFAGAPESLSPVSPSLLIDVKA